MRPVSLLQGPVSVVTTLDDVPRPSDLAQVITRGKWSPARYVDNYRKKENARDVGWLVYDVDGGLPIEEAVRRLDASGMAYLVGASPNHQRQKNGIVADRYRVALPMEETVSDPAAYEATWNLYVDSLGLPADRGARDISRYWNPCREDVMYIKDEGEAAEVIHGGVPEPLNHYKASSDMEVVDRERFAKTVIKSVQRKMREASGTQTKYTTLVSCAASLGRLVTLGADIESLRSLLVAEIDNWGDQVKDRAHALRAVDEQLGWGASNGHRLSASSVSATTVTDHPYIPVLSQTLAGLRGASSGAPLPQPASAPTANSGKLKTYTMQELGAMDLQRPEPVAGALTLGATCFVYAKPNMRKTWFVLELARRAVKAGRRVHMVAEEGHLFWLRWRAQAMGLGDAFFLSPRNGVFLDDAAWVDAIDARSRELGCDVIILDPLADMMRVNENSADELHPIRLALKKLKGNDERLVIAVHHSGKAADGPDARPNLYNIRGHSSFPGMAEFMYELWRNKEANRSEVWLTKNRDGAVGQEGYIETVFPGDNTVQVDWVPQEEAVADREEARREAERKAADDRLECSMDLERIIKATPGLSLRRIIEVMAADRYSEREVREGIALLVNRGLVRLDPGPRGSHMHVWVGA